MTEMRLPTASGLFTPFINKGYVRPFFMTNVGSTLSQVIRFNVTPSAGSKFYFDNVPFAANNRAITPVTSIKQPTVIFDNVSYNVATTDQYSEAVLVLICYNNPDRVIMRIPLGSMAQNANANKMTFMRNKVDWKNSYVQFNSNVGLITTAEVFLLNIYYD